MQILCKYYANIVHIFSGVEQVRTSYLLEKILSLGRIPLDNILEIYLSLGIKEETIVENKFY